MHTGSLEVRLRIRESRSLKDKRQVVRSIVERLKNGYNVAVGETASLDDHQAVVLGIATVGAEAVDVKTTLDRVADALRKHPIAEFCSCESLIDRVFG
jgi:uncharacterized protein YlxP (DUF503 family)